MLSYIISDGIARAMPFLVMPILALYLNTEEFGMATNYMVLAQFFGAFIGLGTDSFINVEYYRVDKNKKGTLISSMIAINIFVSIIILLLLPFLSSKVHNWLYLVMQWQLLAVLMMFCNTVLSALIIYLRLEENLKLYRKIQFFRSSTSALLSLFFVVLLGLGWQGRVYGLLVTALILGTLSFAIFYRKKILAIKIEKKIIINAIKYGIPLLPHKLSTWIRSGFEKIVITEKMSIADTGVFAFGQNISSAMSLFIESFFGAFSPFVYKKLSSITIKDKNESLIKTQIVRISYLSIGIFGMLSFIMFFILKLGISCFFDNAYGQTIIYLPYFFLGIFLNFIYSIFSLYVFYSKKTQYMGLITITVAVIQSTMTWVLVSKYGTIGAAYAIVIGASLKAISVFFYSRSVYPMPWSLNTILKS